MKSKKIRSCTKHLEGEHSKHEGDGLINDSNAKSWNFFDFKITDLFLVAFVILLFLQGKFGIPTLRVLIDDSMEPDLPFGSIALMQPVTRKGISHGDIIMLEDKSSLVRICHVARADKNGLFCFSQSADDLLWLGFPDQGVQLSKNIGYIPWIGLAHVFAYKMKRALLVVALNIFFQSKFYIRAAATALLYFLTLEVPFIVNTIGASSIVLLWIAGDNRYGTTFSGRIRTLVALLLVFVGSLLTPDTDLGDLAGMLLALTMIAMETLHFGTLFFIIKKITLRVFDEAEKASLLVTDPRTSYHLEQAWNELVTIFVLNTCKTSTGCIKSRYSCACCGEAALKKCGGCQSVHYCSPECQRSDWSNHRMRCTPKQCK